MKGLDNTNKKHTTLKLKRSNPPVEGKHNKHISGHAQRPDDKDEQGDDVVRVVGHIHLVDEAALGVGCLWLHALSGPHG